MQSSTGVIEKSLGSNAHECMANWSFFVRCLVYITLALVTVIKPAQSSLVSIPCTKSKNLCVTTGTRLIHTCVFMDNTKVGHVRYNQKRPSESRPPPRWISKCVFRRSMLCRCWGDPCCALWYQYTRSLKWNSLPVVKHTYIRTRYTSKKRKTNIFSLRDTSIFALWWYLWLDPQVDTALLVSDILQKNCERSIISSHQF